MKKIAIIIIVLGMAFSYSCKKDKEVSTSISGQLRTNGTEDIIKMSTEVSHPVVVLYEYVDYAGQTAGGHRVIAKTTVDANGMFSFKEDLKKDELYYLGVENLDTTIYWQPDHNNWTGVAITRKFNVIEPGEDNNKIMYISAKSWVNYHFINSVSNSNTVFNILEWGLILTGNVDTILNWNYKTWSGKYDSGYNDGIYQNSHHVEGKLTRNGVTKDTNIFYSVPPFDTNIVTIYY